MRIFQFQNVSQCPFFRIPLVFSVWRAKSESYLRLGKPSNWITVPSMNMWVPHMDGFYKGKTWVSVLIVVNN